MLLRGGLIGDETCSDCIGPMVWSGSAAATLARAFCCLANLLAGRRDQCARALA